MKGIVGELQDMKIHLKSGAKPIKKMTYSLNLKYKENVWQELDKILAIGKNVPMEES